MSTHRTTQTMDDGKGINVHVHQEEPLLAPRIKLVITDDLFANHEKYFGAYLTPAQAAEIASALMREATEILIGLEGAAE
jgi:hypothetical protein